MLFGSASWLLIISFIYGSYATEHSYNIVETEMFAIQISPKLFNWTYQLFDQQFRFEASLMGKPDLPSWLKYIYSKRHHSGFIYGTPPKGTKSPVMLLVIGINHQDFEARKLFLLLKIHKRDKVATREVEMKIDNLNVEDLLDDRMTRLKDIFRSKLWPESSTDMYATFLSSAVDMGARLPLKPSEGEGVVVRLGSTSDWSTEVVRVREEVRPLSRLGQCPRDYKRTTVERYFREHNFNMDWCNFALYNTYYHPNGTLTHADYTSETPLNPIKPTARDSITTKLWAAPRRSDLPSRNYLRDFVIAVVVPVLLMLLSIGGLTGVMCFRYAGVAHKSIVEVCRYSEPQEHVSKHSPRHSQNTTPARLQSPKSCTNLAGDYNRPQPPPYLTSKRIMSAETQRNIALEESIKLLNEANIANYKVIDYADGSEDYVPVKPDQTGFATEPDSTGLVSDSAITAGDMATSQDSDKAPVKTWFC